MAADSDTDWQAVTARSLAFLCLAQADLRDKGIVPQAQLLETLGLSRKDSARLLNTTDRSLAELLSRARRQKGGRRGKPRKG